MNGVEKVIVTVLERPVVTVAVHEKTEVNKATDSQSVDDENVLFVV
jgi:hypothetical protein